MMSEGRDPIWRLNPTHAASGLRSGHDLSRAPTLDRVRRRCARRPLCVRRRFERGGRRTRCQGDHHASASPEAEAEADSEATGPDVEPNVGDRALRVGEPRRGAGATTTLQEIRFPYPPGGFNTPQQGNSFLGLRLRQCVTEGYDPATGGGDVFSTFNGEWYAVSPSGEQTTGGLSDIAWPRPKFPEQVVINPGDCLKGWITIEVPAGYKIEKMLWRSGQLSIAEWLP